MKEREQEQEEEGTYEHGLEDEQNDEHVVASCWQRMLPNLLPSLSILQPPVSSAVFLLLLLAFPWIRFSLWDLLLLLLLLLSLSLSLSKQKSIWRRKKEKNVYHNPHQSSGSNEEERLLLLLSLGSLRRTTKPICKSHLEQQHLQQS